ncbi:MAG: hypothetical protein KJ600_06500 [Nanoarchaeota archaeon]|nr:hypothetical protein [Nanoarchaeota archaeon]MBU1104175.1 hypothetical protein [Nanoarchaeota archaeon]
MQYQNIEFVCAGNKGRSPLAEAFAKRYLDRKGLVEEVELSSSGTLVNFLKNPDMETLGNLLERFSYKALQQGIINDDEVGEIKQRRNLDKILDKIFEEIRKRESEQRRIVLGEKGIFTYLNPNRQSRQTIVRANAELILPMDEENYGRVQGIYAHASTTPKIELIGKIDDPILSTLEEYRAIVNQVEEATERAMDKFL